MDAKIAVGVIVVGAGAIWLATKKPTAPAGNSDALRIAEQNRIAAEATARAKVAAAEAQQKAAEAQARAEEEKRNQKLIDAGEDVLDKLAAMDW